MDSLIKFIHFGGYGGSALHTLIHLSCSLWHVRACEFTQIHHPPANTDYLKYSEFIWLKNHRHRWNISSQHWTFCPETEHGQRPWGEVTHLTRGSERLRVIRSQRLYWFLHRARSTTKGGVIKWVQAKISDISRWLMRMNERCKGRQISEFLNCEMLHGICGMPTQYQQSAISQGTYFILILYIIYVYISFSFTLIPFHWYLIVSDDDTKSQAWQSYGLRWCFLDCLDPTYTTSGSRFRIHMDARSGPDLWQCADLI